MSRRMNLGLTWNKNSEVYKVLSERLKEMGFNRSVESHKKLTAHKQTRSDQREDRLLTCETCINAFFSTL